MKKITSFMTLLLMALSVCAKTYVTKIKKIDNNVAFNIVIRAYLYVEDAELEATLAKEMFHHEGDLRTACEAYLSQFANAKREDVVRRTIEITARTVYSNDSIGVVCMSYNSAGREHIADVSDVRHFIYDMKAGKTVKLSDLVTPALSQYLKGQGIDADAVTDLKTGLYTYSAKANGNEINLTPYKLYKQMTDYGLRLIGMTRDRIEQQIAEGQDLSKVYDVVEVMPSFPGGTPELMKYLSSNIKYPVDAEADGIQGRVVVSFVVDRDGNIRDITVYNGVESSLNAEAVRVVSMMPKWNPGRNKDTAVNVRYTLPVTFRLQ